MKKRILSLALTLSLCAGLGAAIPASAYNMGKAELSSTLSAGTGHTAVVAPDGTLQIWGNEQYGQTGSGRTDGIGSSNRVLTDVVSVACGASHTAAIRKDGTLWLWGSDTYGEIGTGGKVNGSTESGEPVQTEPVQVMEDVAAVSCGANYTAAVKTDGTLWTWGWNESGTLGLGNTRNRNKPTQVRGLENVVAVSCGYIHTAAITADGTLWIWGANQYGQLGSGASNATIQVGGIQEVIQTKPVKAMVDVAAVSCGQYHTVALKRDGTVWTWGHNRDGQLGDGNRSDRSWPVKIAVEDAVAVSAGDANSAAVVRGGTAYVWGSYVDPASGERTQSTEPTVFLEGMNAAAVSCGYDYTAFLDGTGIPVLNGTNTYGQFLGMVGAKENMAAGRITDAAAALPTPDPLLAIVGSFTDVRSYSWFAKQVEWAVGRHITSGTTPTAFSPNETCTQGQILAMIYAAAGKPAPTLTQCPYENVEQGKYYYDAVLWACEKGLLTGETFDPKAPCTRLTAVTYLYLLLEGPVSEDAAPGDAEFPEDAEAPGDAETPAPGDAEAPEDAGTPGDAGTTEDAGTPEDAGAAEDAEPSEDAGAPETPPAPAFPDIGSLADYEGGDPTPWYAVAWAARNGITAGLEDGTFGVDVSCTRAQIVTFLYAALGGPAE